MAVSQLGVATLAVDATSGGVTWTTVPAGTTQAILRCETAPVRWRADGTGPTATVGTPMNVGDTLLLVGNDYGDFMRRMKWIRTTGTSGAIEGAFLNGYDRA